MGGIDVPKGPDATQRMEGFMPKTEALSTGEALSAEVANKIVAAFQQNGKVDQYKEKIMDKYDKAKMDNDKDALARHRAANDGFVKDVTGIGWTEPYKLLKPKQNPVANIKNATENMVKMEFNENPGSKIEWNKIIDKIYNSKDDNKKRKFAAKLDKFLAVIDKSVKAMG